MTGEVTFARSSIINISFSLCSLWPLWLNKHLRRGTEVVVTGSTRNRLGGQKLSRGFESHPLRHAPRRMHGSPELYGVQTAGKFAKEFVGTQMNADFQDFKNIFLIFRKSFAADICENLRPNEFKKYPAFGGIAERCPSWLKGHDWKSCVPPKVGPRVRIPLSPP